MVQGLTGDKDQSWNVHPVCQAPKSECSTVSLCYIAPITMEFYLNKGITFFLKPKYGLNTSDAFFQVGSNKWS